MQFTVIFDIDGTLADCRHRLHHVTGGNRNWEAFFAGMADDPAIEPVCSLARHLDCKVIFVSGRPERYRAVTQAWLETWVEMRAPLYMRPDDDTRADHIVKREILEQIRKDGHDPQLVIDDRPSVVEMWRAEGLVCLQNAYIEQDRRHAGKTLLHLMVGPSGAGKSTWLRAENIPPRAIISSDEVRLDLLGDANDQTANDRVFGAVHALARTRLRQGLQTWIDATNLRRKDRLACAGLAPAGSLVTYHVVNRPLAHKLASRGHRPESLIERHEQMYRSQERDIMAGDGLDNVQVVVIS